MYKTPFQQKWPFLKNHFCDNKNHFFDNISFFSAKKLPFQQKNGLFITKNHFCGNKN
jgi:hypothetical protein